MLQQIDTLLNLIDGQVGIAKVCAKVLPFFRGYCFILIGCFYVLEHFATMAGFGSDFDIGAPKIVFGMLFEKDVEILIKLFGMPSFADLIQGIGEPIAIVLF